MTSAPVLDLQGKKLGEVGLDDSVFSLKPNGAVLHSALLRQLANARGGAANTKTRSEVSGGGKKPWRQKGTGRARAGSIRSPLWEGGGVIFGPKPRDYSLSMTKKTRTLAVKSALSARREHLVIVDNFKSLRQSKTKEMAQILKNLKLNEQKVLLVLDFASPDCQKVHLAARNLKDIKVLHMQNLNVKDLLEYEAVLTTQEIIKAINDRFKSMPKQNNEVKRSKVQGKFEPKAKGTKEQTKTATTEVIKKKAAASSATSTKETEVKTSGTSRSKTKPPTAKSSDKLEAPLRLEKIDKDKSQASTKKESSTKSSKEKQPKKSK